MVDGRNIVTDDPIRCEFPTDSRILRAHVIKSTRSVIRFTATVDFRKHSSVLLNFDFLDPGDGAVVELLHTSEKEFPIVAGTVKGVPRGIQNWGQISRSRSAGTMFLRQLIFIAFISVSVGVSMAAIEVFAPGSIFQSNRTPDSNYRWFAAILLLPYLLGPILLLWNSRRRFPRSLLPTDWNEL